MLGVFMLSVIGLMMALLGAVMLNVITLLIFMLGVILLTIDCYDAECCNAESNCAGFLMLIAIMLNTECRYAACFSA